MKLYVVMTGYYSDSEIVGIFSTKEKADYAAARIQGACIEDEYTLNEATLDSEKPLVADFHRYVIYDCDGKGLDIKHAPGTLFWRGVAPEGVSTPRVNSFGHHLECFVRATHDKAIADKTAVETYQEYIRLRAAGMTSEDAIAQINAGST